MKLNKIFAGVLAATLTITSSSVAFAAETSKEEGTSGGTGTFEGSVATDVFDVQLPTDSTSAFDFKVDPEGLIGKTSGARYSDKTFEANQTVYFANTADDAENNFSSTSDTLEIVNQSSTAVDVSVSAAVTGNTNIKLTTDKTFENDKTTSLYLAIKSGDKETALSSTGAKVTDTIGAAPERSYSTSWDEESNKYVYALPDDTSTIEFAKYSFSLTGAANTNGDWSKIEESPAVSVTYTVVPHVDAYVSATTLSVGSESVTLSSLPEGVTIKSVVLNKTDGSTVTLTSGSTYTLSGSKLSIKAAMVSAYPGATVKVTYSDGHEDTLTIQ